jgi:hypothetical protein
MEVVFRVFALVVKDTEMESDFYMSFWYELQEITVRDCVGRALCNRC